MSDQFAGRLDIAVSRVNGSVLIRAEGEVDLDNTDQLATALRSAATEPSDAVVLDLVGVPFMDSSGLKTLLVASGDLGERLILAVTPNSPVASLLELAEVRDRFLIHDTSDDAIRARGGTD